MTVSRFGLRKCYDRRASAVAGTHGSSARIDGEGWHEQHGATHDGKNDGVVADGINGCGDVHDEEIRGEKTYVRHDG